MDNDTTRMPFDSVGWTAWLLATLVLFGRTAWASSEVIAVTHPKWKAECGSCHTAYPPQLLPAAAWARIMSGLDQHFGADASLDAGSVAEIGAFLAQHAGSGERVRGARTLRITESTWFRREHREVPAMVWKLPAVKTPANCAACHTTADQGDFRERNLRVPHY